jgi:hypothetical protein
MPITPASPRLLDEVAEFLASSPTPEQILAFRPSEPVQRRARELLARQNAGQLTREEERELAQFENTEILMRLVKARLRSKTIVAP